MLLSRMLNETESESEMADVRAPCHEFLNVNKRSYRVPQRPHHHYMYQISMPLVLTVITFCSRCLSQAIHFLRLRSFLLVLNNLEMKYNQLVPKLIPLVLRASSNTQRAYTMPAILLRYDSQQRFSNTKYCPGVSGSRSGNLNNDLVRAGAIVHGVLASSSSCVSLKA